MSLHRRPQAKSSLEKVHQERLQHHKIKVSAAWSGSPPRAPQADGSPPSLVLSQGSQGCPLPMASVGCQPQETHPCSSVILAVAEPESLRLIEVVPTAPVGTYVPCFLLVMYALRDARAQRWKCIFLAGLSAAQEFRTSQIHLVVSTGQKSIYVTNGNLCDHVPT